MSRTVTSWGTSNTTGSGAVRVRRTSIGAKATTVWVVPRSIPTTYRVSFTTRLLALGAYAELDLPTLVLLAGLERDRFEEERADLRHARAERDRDNVPLRAALGRQIDLDGRELLDLPLLP